MVDQGNEEEDDDDCMITKHIVHQTPTKLKKMPMMSAGGRGTGKQHRTYKTKFRSPRKETRNKDTGRKGLPQSREKQEHIVSGDLNEESDNGPSESSQVIRKSKSNSAASSQSTKDVFNDGIDLGINIKESSHKGLTQPFFYNIEGLKLILYCYIVPSDELALQDDTRGPLVGKWNHSNYYDLSVYARFKGGIMALQIYKDVLEFAAAPRNWVL